MLFWMAITIFGFSLGMIWHNSSKKKNERNLKLKAIRSKIEANEKSKIKNCAIEELGEVESKLEEFKNK